ncbi:proline racemase family protein [Spiribacter roseus]|uniref:Proline racemase family protein n=1 Tax=Spiribacter roseus TaxID=1855875 RepID=A0ABV3RW50_9GAMM
MSATDPGTLEWMDVAVGSDIHRVVFAGVPTDATRSVRERMEWLSGPGDGLRQLLIEPPYGTPTFCVDLLTLPDDPEAQAAFIIMEVMGYPFFSGSNTMATACALIESGRIHGTHPDGTQCLRLEAPGGRVDAHVQRRDGQVVRVTVEGDEAFVHRADARVELPGLGTVAYDLVWSGGHYVMVNADSLGLRPADAGGADALALAARIIEAVQADFQDLHPRLGDVGAPRFLHWMWPETETSPGSLQATGGTYGHPGVLWGCPTGTGTVARLARRMHRGQAGVGTTLRNTSPAGTTFEGRVIEQSRVGDYPSIRTQVSGMPQVVGRCRLSLPATSPVIAERGLEWLLDPRSGLIDDPVRGDTG